VARDSGPAEPARHGTGERRLHEHVEWWCLCRRRSLVPWPASRPVARAAPAPLVSAAPLLCV